MNSHPARKANDAKTTRVSDLKADDFEDAEPHRPDPHAISEITRLGDTVVGLEEQDKRGELAFHVIISDDFRIGRHEDCNLRLTDDSKVSRRHARIMHTGDNYILEDNGSSNGTILNGERIESPSPIRSGDRIIVGSHRFTFVRRRNIENSTGLTPPTP